MTNLHDGKMTPLPKSVRPKGKAKRTIFITHKGSARSRAAQARGRITLRGTATGRMASELGELRRSVAALQEREADALIASPDYRDRERGWALKFQAATGRTATELVNETLARMRPQGRMR